MKFMRNLKREFGFYNTQDPTEKIISALKTIRLYINQILTKEKTFEAQRIVLTHEIMRLEHAFKIRSQEPFRRTDEISSLILLLKSQLKEESFSPNSIRLLSTMIDVLS